MRARPTSPPSGEFYRTSRRPNAPPRANRIHGTHGRVGCDSPDRAWAPLFRANLGGVLQVLSRHYRAPCARRPHPEEHVDVALRLGVLPDSRLISLRLGSTSRVVCASPAYLALHGTPAAPEDLVGHDCSIYEGFEAPDFWTFARGQADVAIMIRPRLVVSTVEAACDAALAGIGLTRAFWYHSAALHHSASPIRG